MEVVVDALDRVFARIVEGTYSAADSEALCLEFKTDGRSVKDDLGNIAEAAACLANAAGGHLVVGVDDRKTGAAAFVGTHLDPEKTRLRIYEVTQPPLLVEAETRTTMQGTVLVLTIPVSTQVHSANGRIPTERVADRCLPMSTERIAAVTARKTGRDWSAQPSGVPAVEADPVSMQVAREMLARSIDLGKRRLAEATDVDLLRALGVVLEDQTLTNAGALLVTRAYEHAVLISYTHRRTPAGQLTANEQLTGPLVVAIQRVFDLIGARLETTPVSIGKGQQLHIADLPEPAVREAVINGVMHRDYFSSERIAVEHTLTQLRVSSPGGFVPGVSVNNVLTTSSRTRNANLAAALRTLGLAETAGSGVDRMYAEMARLGHEPPRFSADFTRVDVTLLGGAPNTSLARYVATLPQEEAVDADTMVILLTLLTQRTVSAEELTPLLQKPAVVEAQSVLSRLSAEEIRLLEPTRETARRAHPKYRLREEALAALGSAVTYRRRTTDQVDRKIIELVNETGVINARMVRVLLDLDTVGASRVLADLVERQILRKTSEATRGPSVTYGKGAAFPAKSSRRGRAESIVSSGRSRENELAFDDLDDQARD
ncbi:ATP-binding protein [Microbacterium panaciterrae]|uniref:ATP-binding protein n=1 Tax=Microbacterium panaciterrae TaxID=985759 RepID=A0ABP8P5B0_9MICO